MLLQYPKLTGTTTIAHYDDYRKMHHHFIRSYKILYEEVAGFSLLPEKFVKDAEPIIQRYLDTTDSPAEGERRIQLQAITDFISRFYEFMDNATEMFVEHQALCDQTVAYMEKVGHLNYKHQGENPADFEEDYIPLIPYLERLNENVAVVKKKENQVVRDLASLRPDWETIKEKIRA
jgi:hypothetical protein